MYYSKFDSSVFFSIAFLCILVACKTDVDKPKGIAQKKSKQTLFSNSTIDLENISALIREELDTNNKNKLVIWDNDSVSWIHDIAQLYSTNSLQPFWISEKGFSAEAASFIEAIPELEFDGLNLHDYHLQELQACMKKTNSLSDSALVNIEFKLSNTFFQITHDMILGNRIGKINSKDWKNKNDSLFNYGILLKQSIANGNFFDVFQRMRPQQYWYAKFRQEYKRLDSLNKSGAWTTFTLSKDSIKNETEISIPNIISLRKRLNKEIGIPKDTNTAIWNEDIINSLKKFQHLHQLKVTGILDSTTINKLNISLKDKQIILANNMEKLRWLKHDFPQPYIWVNIPKMELDYVDHDSVQFNMRVVVGRISRPTPTLDARLENIVFSPPWGVPPTIMKEEVIPGIARKGLSYLSRRGLKAYDRHGHQVNASAINASNFNQYSIQQAPGYSSSLGEVKFNLPNPWSIYLHDTPHRGDFVKSFRAYSSGCIRVHHPKEFAAFLLQDTARYSLSKIDSICKTRKTKYVTMHRDVQVHIVYLTNAIDSIGNIMYLKDLYRLDKKMQ